jgi:tripartite-type tricarboxylate transporter receptor subunit TctC
LRFGHSGVGSTNHLAGELFGVLTGIRLTPIPYKGAASNQLALLQGEIQISMLPVLAAVPQVKAGRIKALGVTGAKRSQAMPEVPTIGETITGYEVPVWYGFVITAKTPAPIADKLHAATQKALLAPEVKDRLFSQGVETQLMSRADFGRLIGEDALRWAKLVKDAGITLE